MAGMKSLPLREVLKTLEKLDTKYAAVAAIGVTTGCRISEILQLRRFDLITPEGELRDHIRFVKLKTRKKNQFRELIIPEDFQNIVKKHLRSDSERGHERPDGFVFRGTMGRPLSRITCYRVFYSVLGKGYGTHWMRKTFAQEVFKYFLAQKCSDLEAAVKVQHLLGHTRLETTIRYLGLRERLYDSAQRSIFNMERIKKDG